MNGGQLVKNAEFQRFAAHWNFTPRACRPYRAQTKGKVERPVRYVRGNFFYGRDFVNDADLNEQARIWLDRKANVRVHYTTRERPYERYLRDEQGVLRPVAERPYTSLMLQPQTELALPTVLPRRLGLAVERRPLSAYADLAERAP